MSEEKPLKKQQKFKAKVIVKLDDAELIMDDCIIFANDPSEEDIVFLAQDPKIDNRKIQVTITKQ